jgi:hypothetical protein
MHASVYGIARSRLINCTLSAAMHVYKDIKKRYISGLSSILFGKIVKGLDSEKV